MMTTGTTFARFLKTGQLGSLTLGMDPSSVELQLGTPEQSSRKLNPLVLKYGPLELTFWSPKAEPPQLAQISLMLSRGLDRLPQSLHFEDWTPNAQTNIEQFKEFVERVHARTDDFLRGEFESEMLFRSGVRALFVSGYLFALHLSKRETDSNRSPILNDEHEPPIEQIRFQLDEARSALQAGFRSAAILLAWAALEAVLRRTALIAGYKGKLRGQPSVLIRELYSLGQLTRTDRELLEALRQQRTRIAHGLIAEPISEDEVINLLQVTKRLMDILPIEPSMH
jgi:hypothetical protein